MENQIERWLSFAGEVEDKLSNMNADIFSDKYRSKLTTLLSQLRHEASLAETLSRAEKQACFSRINYLGQNLRTTAYFC